MPKSPTVPHMLIALALLAGPPLTAFGRWGQKPKAGQETSCEGALEIVPRKSMSFSRKRRPGAAATTAPAARPAAKPGRKPAGGDRP